MYRSKYSTLTFPKSAEPEVRERTAALPSGTSFGSFRTEVQPRSLNEAIKLFGLPSDPIARNAKEEAITLLQIAAEIEHALLVEYLYAAYSINPKPTQSTVGKDWQKTLLRVAKQEMAHLISVQNLLLFLGAKPHFSREEFAQHPTQFPFPFQLERLSLDSLAKYVSAEAPPTDEIPDLAQRQKVEQIKAYAELELHTPIHGVGLIYVKLYLLFQKDDQPAGPWQNIELPAKEKPMRHLSDQDFADSNIIRSFLATQDQWAMGLDAPPTSMHVDDDTGENPKAPKPLRTAALESIAFIAAQGEGPLAQADSHFNHFFTIYEEFESAGTGLGDRVRPVTVNPSLDSGPGLITNQTTKQWARLFNATYQLLVLELLLAMSQDSSIRSALVATAEESDMTPYIRELALQLASQPLGAAGGPNAGAPFALDADSIPSDPSKIPDEMRKRIAIALSVIDSLPAQTDNGFLKLADLKNDFRSRFPVS